MKFSTTMLLIFSVTLTMIFPNSVFAEHIFEDQDAFAQYLDITELMSPKYVLEVDDQSFDIYYGYYGSLDIDFTKEVDKAEISEMTINSERKSIDITIANNPADSIFWVKLPFDVIYAEDEKYTLLIDGVNTGYDLIAYPNPISVGMILPKDAQHIEIIGTQVIPEFGALSIAILGISILGIVYFMRKSGSTSGWPRIN